MGDLDLNILLSLITDDNDFQIEQAVAAQELGGKLGVNLEILYASGDSMTQNQQLLQAIQASKDKRPDGIILEPVGGTALPQVAKAAVTAGVGWAVLNHEAPYLGELRQVSKAPAFAVCSDNREIGRLQGRQIAALLPHGGKVLYIQGPSDSTTTQQRTAGMQEEKPANIQLSMLRGQWTEGSAEKVVASWLSSWRHLSAAMKTQVEAVVAQNDAMAMGARKAIEGQLSGADRERWLRMPFLGVDGLLKTGRSWVNAGLLSATVIVPARSAPALEIMVQALKNNVDPPERKYIAPQSFPAVEKLGLALV